MAITKTIKTPRGYELTGYDLFQEVCPDSSRPPLDPAHRSAPWLPVKVQDKASDLWYTILAGRIVSIDRTLTNKDEWGNSFSAEEFAGGYAPRIVPANSSGAAQPITYGANDVLFGTVNVDNQTAKVTTAGSASATFPANAPVGWSQGNIYSDAMHYIFKNFSKQHAVTLVMDAYIEVALIGLAGQSSLAPGSLVKAYAGQGPHDAYQGCPTYWNPSSDSVEQIAGRVIVMSDIPYGTHSRSRADLVRGMSGLGLPGLDTTGKPRWLSLDGATHFVRINITLM